MEKKVKPLIKSNHAWKSPHSIHDFYAAMAPPESSIRLSGATKGGDGALMTLISKPGLGWKLVACADQLAITKHDRELHVAEEPYSALQVSWSHTCILSHEWTNTPGAHCIIIVCM